MFIDVHLCKRTHISHTFNVDSEMTKKVDYVQRPTPQPKDKNQWSDDGGQKLFKNIRLKS